VDRVSRKMSGMTKDELRSALNEHGISSPSSAKKDELVALYNSVEFSADDDDEEVVLSLKKSSPKKNGLNTSTKAVDSSMIVGDFDVSGLNDDQLAEALIARQIEVGPIVASTRKLYERKLIAAMTKGTNGESNGEDQQNGTSENGHNDSTEQVELQNGDFSADDDEILNSGNDNGDVIDANNDVIEEAGIEVSNGGEDVETEEEEEPEQPSVVVTKRLADPLSEQPKTTSPIASLRNRFMGPDSNDVTTSNGERFTPTPRRSIHSYKVTETTRQTLTKGKDGTLTHDFDYKKETSESKGSLEGTRRGKLASVLRLLPGFFLILLFLVLVYYIYTKRK